MESGITFNMIKGFIKKIWLIVVVVTVLGAALGGILSMTKGEEIVYEANATVLVERKFDTDNNGNGLYDNDINRFWGNFMAFASDPVYLDQLEDKYPDFEDTNLEKAFFNGSNILQLKYRSSDKAEAMGIVNTTLEQIVTNSEKFLSDKAIISNETPATEDNLIEHKTSSLTTDIIIGGIYGFIIGFVLGVCRLFILKKK